MPTTRLKIFLRFVACVLLTMAASAGHAEVTVVDDAGERLTFARPPQRIVSLAPHITELLYAAGAGSAVIAADEYSDYPLAARKLPRIGNAYALDLEAMLALKPDLVIAWKSGGTANLVAKLKSLGMPVFLSEPKTLDDIPRSVETLGRIAGSDTVAQAAAARLRARKAQLEAQFSKRSKVKVVFEIWSPPIMTINRSHLINAVLQLCGAENPFADLATLTPTISAESVVAANPEVILASSQGNARPLYLDDWLRWPSIPAVAHGLVASIPGDFIDRAGPRIFDGAAQICGIVDQARAFASTRNKQP
jgi:iron complex transport system substrate-binding protein